jgi:hypothetical protein
MRVCVVAAGAVAGGWERQGVMAGKVDRGRPKPLFLNLKPLLNSIWLTRTGTWRSRTVMLTCDV